MENITGNIRSIGLDCHRDACHQLSPELFVFLLFLDVGGAATDIASNMAVALTGLRGVSSDNYAENYNNEITANYNNNISPPSLPLTSLPHCNYNFPVGLTFGK